MSLACPVTELAELSSYDPWFLAEMKKIVEIEKRLTSATLASLDRTLLLEAKRLGTSDERLAELFSEPESAVRARRLELSVTPSFKKVDTCAGEFASDTPYLYSTYDETERHHSE